ncbi:hypothetical protein L6R29_13625 [Myxococcota bacterium]|nr:hypothetical protein [Myxococcota bacterium]
MTLLDICQSVKELSRWEKFQLVQQLIADLAQEEQTTPPFDAQMEQGYWSQQNAVEAAVALQEMLREQG